MSEAMSTLSREYRKVAVTIHEAVDTTIPFTARRWAGFGVLISTFVVRILFAQGWYIICYSLGIYLLSLFVAFLTPKFDPSLEQEERSTSLEEGGDTVEELGDEFRPFIRRLPEFRFWIRSIIATSVSLVLSFIPFFDIPVFWPILLVYFVTLFALTMRRQIQHMVKYKYMPFDLGKMRYGQN